MTEFKQIIGRGTRINEDYGKFFFTIMDFKKATELFADPDFDGDPIQVYDPSPQPTPQPKPPPPVVRPERYVVANVEVTVSAERVQYFDAEGKLITESLKDYTRKTLFKEFSSLKDFLKRWSSADKKQAIIQELATQGIFFEALAEEIGRDCDPFDLICHVAWDQPPLTRQERAKAVQKRDYFAKYGEQARRVLEALLEKYADEGIEPIEETQILSIAPFNQLGTPLELVKAFGGKAQYEAAIRDLEQVLYSA